MADRLERPAAPDTGSGARMVDIDGPLCFEEWPGPEERTFVLVHGLGGSHLNWRRVASRLAERGRVLAPDLPGFGLTPRAGRRTTLPANRGLLARFVEAEATGQVIVVGNSMGGAIAQLLAALHPKLVGGVVLSCSIFPWTRGGVPSPLVVGGFTTYHVPWLGPFAVRQRFTRVSPERMVRTGFALTTADPARIPPDVVRDHVELLREHRQDPDAAPAFLEAARSILHLVEHPELGHRMLDAIRCPVLVVHGRRDRFVPVAYAEGVWRDHPSWELRVLPDVGHVPQLEAPERWLEAVDRWLDDRVPAV